MRLKCGPDPEFPYLTEHERLQFPPPLPHDDVVAVGGNLSPGMLLSAYENGIFPWYNEGQPLLWQSPDPRFVLYPSGLHVSKSMRKILRQERFDIRFDTAFDAVIANCAEIKRSRDGGTWITADMRAAYRTMHRIGYAHSAEAFFNGELAGGCYGILLTKKGGGPERSLEAAQNGRVFFGESMFSRVPNASKAAFLALAQKLFSLGLKLIDCQVWSAHLESLGAVEIARNEFLYAINSLLTQA
ncbi:MAG: leucyl/phenylalanyl-tRNA--protein transferase [Spirochaetaceae bacterium]|jgi:leucyl/phenylalanyl-tRNA--protein transferase|nr:leucyl/phenylalanyl-tRNA--protein transferase [Spirochaetaceae bacterium]